MQKVFGKIFKGFVVTVVVAVVLLSGLRLYLNHVALAYLEEAPFGQSVGPADADVTIVEFLDYRCPVCREAHPSVMAFHEKNPDVRIVFRHLPVFGRESLNGIRMALAAGMNGRFPAMHELLIRRAEPVGDGDIDELARQAGLDPEGLRLDMMVWPVTKDIMLSLLAANAMDVKGTPSFAVNGVLLEAASGPDAAGRFEAMVQKARDDAAAGRKKER